ncbi:ArnT family glycosyltransferase [Streptosporangium sp. NBC_01756]|uniref:ArnT family glycosyltransferase n=1 Tax=Streptosporangium sp. NBC_01756 TaxID=2975950 RepID=UPI002DD8A281|nr:glycosyltransferase family 39 protein [Streptosporangium sp. NBC_01756]WSC89400.1 glycosyltransferase family 39 protein [Streptosporangium sp. NBC_01756]
MAQTRTISLPERVGRIDGLSTFAWRPVTVVALVFFSILLAFSPWYGYYKDELYFRMIGEHPDWGYVDQPPLTPLLARAAVLLLGDTVTAVRVPAALGAAALVVLVALIARELGGGRTAQLLAAVAITTASSTVVGGHSLLTTSFDAPLWAAAILFVLRALLRGDRKWWIAAGAVIGIATYNKHLIALLVVGLAVGLAAAGPRRLFRDPRLWAGVLAAVAIAVPNLLYQITNDWPQATMAAALSDDRGAEMRAMFVPMQVLLLGPVGGVFAVAGWVRLWRDRRVRSLAIAYPVAAAVVLLMGGRFDYAAGLLILLLAAGCVSVTAWMADRGTRRRLAVGGLVFNGVYCAAFNLPLIPAAMLAQTPIPAFNEVTADQIGWPEFAAQVTEVVRGLPAGDRAGAVLLAGGIGEAGMLDREADRGVLPPVYSGHNHLHRYGPPPDRATAVIAVRVPLELLNTQFGTCSEAARLDNGLGVQNERQGLPVFVCRGLKEPWSTAWPRFQLYG